MNSQSIPTPAAKRILVVDDAFHDRVIAGHFLTEGGFDTSFAENGQIAIEQIESEPPDLVLTDMMMPVLDGLELVDHIRRVCPSIPVVIMTGYDSAENAVTALQIGAASFIPKTQLKRSVVETVSSVLLTRTAALPKEEAWNYLCYRDSHYVIGYEEHARSSLVARFEEELAGMDFCDKSELIRIGTALTEALANAVDHGNLELDSQLRESGCHAYYNLGRQRTEELPYRTRRVHISSRVTPSEATYVIADEGPGFDYRKLPDPTDPENFDRLSGRGLLLIRTFMDEVRFNESGNVLTMTKRRSEFSSLEA